MPVFPARMTVTCDDCGLSEGINHAAVALHRAGLLTTASVMTTFPATQHALALLHATPTLAAGVHLNLTEGRPLTGAPGLTGADGCFLPRAAMFARLLTADAATVRAAEHELAAQTDAFATSGLVLDHISTHMHFHMVPCMRRAVNALAARYGARWVRTSDVTRSVVPFNVALPRAAARRAAGPPTSDYVVLVQAWVRLGLPVAQLAAHLQGLPGHVEVVVHPCTVTDASYPAGVLYAPAERARESDYLRALAPALAC